MYIVACGLHVIGLSHFKASPDKTGVGIGEEVVKSIFTWSFISTDIGHQYLISSARLNQRV